MSCVNNSKAQLRTTRIELGPSIPLSKTPSISVPKFFIIF
jgi:hypothetical protein